MRNRHAPPPRTETRAPASARRGSALVLVLVMTTALAALALSAIFLTSNATILSKGVDRERDFRYAAEAALAIGKSRLNNDPEALPDTGVSRLMTDSKITAADGTRLTGITTNLWVGPTGAANGQFGSFASVVAEARDARGSRFVRRLELAQENFARYAYWSDRESNMSGTTIYFNNNDVLWGPVWSNDVIHIGSGGATFNDDVGTAKTIDGIRYGTFKKAVLQRQKPIQLPSTAKLGKLEGYAGSGRLSFNAPTNGDASTVKMRVEFVALNLDPLADNDVTDDDEGFVRVYRAYPSTSARYARGDYTADNCGDWHRSSSSAPWKFYPASIHDENNTWFVDTIRANGTMSLTEARNHAKAGRTSWQSVMARQSGKPDPRCFPGGDPHLVAVERNDPSRWTAAQRQIGGDELTFTAVGTKGEWLPWAGIAEPVDPRLSGRGDARYLFPLYRGLNPGSKGVIYTSGTVGVSGVVRGRVTLYATGNIVLLDDTKYSDPKSSDPQSDACLDILGLIAAKDVVVADNALNSPQPQASNGYRSFDDTKDFHLQAVMMALGSSFGVEDYDAGGRPSNVNGCEGTRVERGCLYLSGGIIQKARGAVGQTASGGATGFSKRYSYDRCAFLKSPPYFPTTGRFIDNRYYEVDPVGFDAAALFSQLRPNP